MLFDTHAHMDDRAFDADREALLSSLPQQGIALLMNPGCSLESSRAACGLARRYDYLYAAVGSHPDAADEVTESVLETYRALCRDNPKVKAIGEIGLDYHYEDVPRQRQLEAFRAQMALAEAGIQLYAGCSGSADQCVTDLLSGTLAYADGATCDHHHEGSHSCGGHGHTCGHC